MRPLSRAAIIASPRAAHPAALLAALLAAALAPIACDRAPDAAPAAPTAVATAPASAPATLVGGARCATCHEREHALWVGSHHDLAMQAPTDGTVQGDFSGVSFTAQGVTSVFRRDGDAFVVRTEGPDGAIADFPVRYVFGFTPLEQYLIELPGGRLQAFDVAWDARPAAAGGQRWFHLQPNEQIDRDDPLHWSRRFMNWNQACADCHSTGFEKRYDESSNAYDSRFAEIDVSCETCHGPGSRHVAWADAGEDPDDAAKGLAPRMAGARLVDWAIDPATGIAQSRERPRSDREVQVCARCHARRSPFAGDDEPGTHLLHAYRLSLLTDPLYYPDGQILDEVFVHGSFLQSRMHAKGVTCSDCHDPHSLRPIAPGNDLCARCHEPARFDAPSHHGHEAGTPGAACVDCHMPARTYMVVDPRRDHSFRVPRPDHTRDFGVPNACQACHADRGDDWILASFVAQWGERDRDDAVVRAFAAARRDAPEAAGLLDVLARDEVRPAIVRATALAELDRLGDLRIVAAIADLHRDADPLVRAAIAEALQWAPPALRERVAAPLLTDAVRGVRIAAARSLVEGGGAPASATNWYRAALAEYAAGLDAQADRPEARLSRGLLLALGGDLAGGERDCRAAVAMDPDWAPASVNLSDILRAQGRDAEGAAVLQAFLRRDPASAAAHHALGLALVRLGDLPGAAPHLAEAWTLSTVNPRYGLAAALAYDQLGDRRRALGLLEEVVARHPRDEESRAALDELLRR